MAYNRNFSIFGTEEYYRDYKDASDDRIIYDYLDQLKGIDPRRAKMIRNELAKNPEAFDDLRKKIREAKKSGRSSDIESVLHDKVRSVLDSKNGFWNRTKEDNEKAFLDIAKTMLRNRRDFSETREFSSVREDKRAAYDAIDSNRGLSDDDPRRTSHRMDVLDSFVRDGVLSTIRDQIDDRRNRQLSKRADRLTARAQAEESLSNARSRINNARHRNDRPQTEREHRSIASILEMPGDFIHELRMHRREHQRAIRNSDREEAAAQRVHDREERADQEHQEDRDNAANDRAERIRHANQQADRMRTSNRFRGYEVTVSADGRRITAHWTGRDQNGNRVRPTRGQRDNVVIDLFSETPASRVVDKAKDVCFNLLNKATTAMYWMRNPEGALINTAMNKAPRAAVKAATWVDKKLGAVADKIGNTAPMRAVKKPFEWIYDKTVNRGPRKPSIFDKLHNAHNSLKEAAYNIGKKIGKGAEGINAMRGSGNNYMMTSWSRQLGQAGNSQVDATDYLKNRVEQQRNGYYM